MATEVLCWYCLNLNGFGIHVNQSFCQLNGNEEVLMRGVLISESFGQWFWEPSFRIVRFVIPQYEELKIFDNRLLMRQEIILAWTGSFVHHFLALKFSAVSALLFFKGFKKKC